MIIVENIVKLSITAMIHAGSNCWISAESNCFTRNCNQWNGYNARCNANKTSFKLLHTEAVQL